MSQEGIKSVAPMDEVLRIDNLPFKITIAMMLKITQIAIRLGSYNDAQKHFFENDGIRLSDDQIRKVVNYIGEIVYQEDCRLAEEAMCSYNPSSAVANRGGDGQETLYIEADGAMVNTRDGLECGAGWRENKLGMVFNSKHIEHYVDQNGRSQHRISRREYINFLGPASEFQKHLLALAIRNGCLSASNVVIISDGAIWIKRMRTELFPYSIHILDLYHLKENVGNYAKYIFNNIECKYHPWADKVCCMLEEGKWKDVLSLDDVIRHKDKTPDGVVNLYSYIYNNRDSIDYPRYKSKGLFVGSGAIESGNKNVVQARLKLPGMRWKVDNARRILALRAKDKSNLWDTKVSEIIHQKMDP